jgi:hypothetical protein
VIYCGDLPISFHISLISPLLSLHIEPGVLYPFASDVCRKCSLFIGVILNLMVVVFL